MKNECTQFWIIPNIWEWQKVDDEKGRLNNEFSSGVYLCKIYEPIIMDTTADSQEIIATPMLSRMSYRTSGFTCEGWILDTSNEDHEGVLFSRGNETPVSGGLTAWVRKLSH